MEQHTLRPSNAPLFRTFVPLTEDEVKKEIINMTAKSCKLDPVPTDLLKQSLPKCLSTIMQIVNMSLTQGHKVYLAMSGRQPLSYPYLKKQVWPLSTKNYWPVSNLCLLSKVVEKCQLIDHCDSNNLLPDFQLLCNPKFI